MVIVVAGLAIVAGAASVVVAAAVLSSRISRVADFSCDEGALAEGRAFDSPLEAS